MNARFPHRWLHLNALLVVMTILLAAASACWAQGTAQAEKDLAFAQGLHAQENYKLAADKFVAFVKRYPGHANMPLALFRAGECLFRLGEFTEAAPHFEQVTKQFPKSEEAEPAWLWLGDSQFQAEQYEPAANAYASLLEKFPDSKQAGRAAYWRGESLYHLGKHEDAVAAYRDALGRKPSDQESAYAMYAIGWTYLQLDKPRQAVLALQEVLKKHPNSPVAAECRQLIGAAHQAQKDYDAARQTFKQVLDKHADSRFAAEAQMGIAWCYFEEKAYEQALKAFTIVTQDHATSPVAAEVPLRIADCQFHLKRWPEAAKLYEKAAADKDSKWADEGLYWLAITHEQAGDAAKAVETHNRLVKQFKQSKRVPDSYLHIGRLEGAAGHAQAAMAAYQAASKATDNPAQQQQALKGLAWAKYQSEKSDASLEDLEKLVIDDPKSPQAAELGYQVAYAHFGAERYQAALKMVEMVIENHPKSKRLGASLYLAGACHEKLGNDQQAAEFYRRVLTEATASDHAGHAAAALVGLYAKQGELEKARSIAGDMQQAGASPEAISFALYTVAEALHKEKKHAEAIPLYAKAVEAAPEGSTAPHAQLGLGWARLAAADPAAAEAFQTLAEQYPDSDAAKRAPEGLLAVGEKLFEQEKYPQAQAIYQRIIDDFGASEQLGSAQYKLAWSLLKQEKPGEALPFFSQAAAKASSEAVVADARYQAGRLLAESKDYKGVAAILDPFRQQYDDSDKAPAALALLGRASAELKREDVAKEVFRTVLAKYPDHPAAARAHLGMARIHRAHKDLDKAVESLEKALAQSGGAVAMEAQYELASCYQERGETAKAAEEFLKVAILYGDDEWSARAQYQAGQCYEKLEDSATAISTYEVIIKNHPDEKQWVEKAQARVKALR